MAELGYSYTNPTLSENKAGGGGDVPVNALRDSSSIPILDSSGAYLVTTEA